jgi:hypothetical protein
MTGMVRASDRAGNFQLSVDSCQTWVDVPLDAVEDAEQAVRHDHEAGAQSVGRPCRGLGAALPSELGDRDPDRDHEHGRRASDIGNRPIVRVVWAVLVGHNGRLASVRTAGPRGGTRMCPTGAG